MSDKATKTATDAAGDPTSAAGALAGKDSALGGLGGRKPGPANRADDEGIIKADEPKDDKPSSLQIRIKLDLDVEIHLTARARPQCFQCSAAANIIAGQRRHHDWAVLDEKMGIQVLMPMRI